ncbi:unannotated protein [freshwater metagenome]|uniref:Unannotated protein n=1 Tax=freshwater metagenome TaxID=449393 RepID=A0A6J7BXZ9_9ZZZZ|nr:alpha/beta hydrolase fold domain-containing protein [Actinomycetota bacterium]
MTVPTKSPHDRAVQMFVAATPPVGAPISQWREGFEALCADFVLPTDADVVPLNLGGVPALRITAPGSDPTNVVLHFHSGGYVEGSAKGYREFAYRLSAATGTPVIVIDYRLAPEFMYPAPIEDAVASYQALLADYPSTNIVLTGDSVGGAMVIAALMLIRDERISPPAAGVSICGNMDLAGETASFDTNSARDPLIDRHMVVEVGKVYIGDLGPKQTPLASPLYGDHHDLPPLLLLASDSEVLRDGSVVLGERVRAAGGSAVVVLEPDMVHIWTLFPFLPEAAKSMSQIGAFVRSSLLSSRVAS